MPLENVKSVVYRSFITCEDPKGVFDCNTIKISKGNSQKLEQKIKTHRTGRNSKGVLVSKGEKEELRERIHGQSSVPIMEVCQDAEKLNQMVDSWSKGVRSDCKSKEIAEDLLEGASSLRESLIMLAKLQGASNESIRRSSFYRYGSSRNCADEVKKVIKDSLVRRDVTAHDVAVGEKSCFRDMNSESGSEDIPSTSSSQSSMVNDNVNCYHASTSAQKCLKRNNLIAKLMGLEEISSRSVQTTPKNEIEFKKVSSYKTSLFAIDTMRNALKSKSVINKEDPEKKTLREILEKMPFKRHMGSDPYKEFKLCCPDPYNNGSKQRSKGVPPIVLIKPKLLPPNALEERRARTSLKAEALNQKAPRSFDGAARKLKPEGLSLKQTTQEGKISMHKEVRKSRRGSVDTKKKAEEKLKTSNPIQDMPHEKYPTDKKVTSSTKKPVEKEFAKEKVVSRPQHQEKVTSTNPRKNKTHKQRSSIPDAPSGRVVRAISNDPNCHRKEEPVLTCSEVKSLIHMVEAKKDDESTDTNECADIPINQNKITLRALITMESDTDECDTKIIECCKESLNTLSTLSSKLEIGTSNDPNHHTEKETVSYDQGTNLKALLLRSSSFLCHAGELFDLHLNSRTMLQAASRCNDPETPDTKPYIDCAIELVERKCHHHDLRVANPKSNTRIEISVERLVKEVCNDIDTLTSCRNIHGDNLLVDPLYAVLERDLWYKEMMNGMWDFGWKNGFSRSESEEVVNDIEKLILSELIDESLK